jgi:hypothetical protein
MAVMVRAGLGVGRIVTVPAHNFWAPTRAKLIAALRSIRRSTARWDRADCRE